MHASAFRRTSFDHITCASESSTFGRAPPRAVERTSPARASAPRTRRSTAGHVDEQERARVHDHARPAAGPPRRGSSRRAPCPGAKRSRSSAMWSSPLSSGSTSGGSTSIALERRVEPGGLGRDDQRVDRLRQPRDRARARDEARRGVTLLHPQAVARRSPRRSPRARPRRHLVPGAVERRRRAGRPTPPGPSTAIFIGAAIDQHAGVHHARRGRPPPWRRAARRRTGSGRWRSYQGR